MVNRGSQGASNLLADFAGPSSSRPPRGTSGGAQVRSVSTPPSFGGGGRGRASGKEKGAGRRLPSSSPPARKVEPADRSAKTEVADGEGFELDLKGDSGSAAVKKQRGSSRTTAWRRDGGASGPDSIDVEACLKDIDGGNAGRSLDAVQALLVYVTCMSK